MRHRIVSGTGLGNPEPELLDNKGKLDKELCEEVLDSYFAKYEGFDFSVKKDKVMIGVEPAYQYENLKIICIHKNIEESYIRNGIAFGPYGSKIVGSQKFYKDYKRSCKFKRLIDKYHSKLFKR